MERDNANGMNRSHVSGPKPKKPKVIHKPLIKIEKDKRCKA
jgi:hypothetical protein